MQIVTEQGYPDDEFEQDEDALFGAYGPESNAQNGTYGYPEDEIETLHVYVYQDKPPYWNRHRVIAVLMGLLALSMIVGLCCIPSTPNYTIETITVPARISIQEVRA